MGAEAHYPSLKPDSPLLMSESFNRLPQHLLRQPRFFKGACPFRSSQLPQLPPLHNPILAEIITSPPPVKDHLGVDRQTWNEGKHTLASLALRGKMYFVFKVMETVQDLAPGPFKDIAAIQAITDSIISTDTLALLASSYALGDSPDRMPTSWEAVNHAADMFLAYIGALRVPFSRDPLLADETIFQLDRFLDDLISPNVWVKLDDLVKARSRGQKFGEEQLLYPAKKGYILDRQRTLTSSNYITGSVIQRASDVNHLPVLYSPAKRVGSDRGPAAPNQADASRAPRQFSSGTSSSDSSYRSTSDSYRARYHHNHGSAYNLCRPVPTHSYRPKYDSYRPDDRTISRRGRGGRRRSGPALMYQHKAGSDVTMNG